MKTELDPRETGIRNIVADACFFALVYSWAAD